MESKHKNALIGALLAVVFVMAVGYAALSQQLTITGTAEITDQSASWTVHFDNTKTTDTAVEATPGAGATQQPNGTIEYSDNNHAVTLNANLIQPGDTVVFELAIKNEGSVTAALAAPEVSVTAGGENTGSGNTYKLGNIIFEVGTLTSNSIAQGESSTITVTARFDQDATQVGTVHNAGIKLLINANQA